MPRACLDFDAVALETLDRRTENGSLAFEAAGSSAPNALLATIANDREGRAFVRMPLDGSPTRISWSFDVRLDRAGQLVEFCELRLTYSGGICAIQPQIAGGELRVNEYCEGSVGSLQRDHKVTNAVEGTGYHRFSIAVDFESRKVTAQVQRPGMVAVPIEYTLEDRIVTAPAEVRPGVSWSPAHPTGPRILIDNVTLDWQ